MKIAHLFLIFFISSPVSAFDKIIIGGIRSPGAWLYPDVDIIYSENDDSVFIINDQKITNPNLLAQVGDESLKLLFQELKGSQGQVSKIIFEHVGYGLQHEHFKNTVPFLTSLLKPGGKIVYISYRVPFSTLDRRQKEITEGTLKAIPDFCQLCGLPEPIVRDLSAPPVKTLAPADHLEKLKVLHHALRQKINEIIEINSCADPENDESIKSLMGEIKTIYKKLGPSRGHLEKKSISLLSSAHNQIVNCAGNGPHKVKICALPALKKSHMKSALEETKVLFIHAGLDLDFIGVERTDDVFAFVLIFQKKPDKCVADKPQTPSKAGSLNGNRCESSE